MWCGGFTKHCSWTCKMLTSNQFWWICHLCQQNSYANVIIVFSTMCGVTKFLPKTQPKDLFCCIPSTRIPARGHTVDSCQAGVDSSKQVQVRFFACVFDSLVQSRLMSDDLVASWVCGGLSLAAKAIRCTGSSLVSGRWPNIRGFNWYDPAGYFAMHMAQRWPSQRILWTQVTVQSIVVSTERRSFRIGIIFFHLLNAKQGEFA